MIKAHFFDASIVSESREWRGTMNERRVKGPYGLFLSHHSHNRSVRTLHTHVRRSIRSVPFCSSFNVWVDISIFSNRLS